MSETLELFPASILAAAVGDLAWRRLGLGEGGFREPA